MQQANGQQPITVGADLLLVETELRDIVKAFADAASIAPSRPLPDALRFLKLVRDTHATFSAIEKAIQNILDGLRHEVIPQMYKEAGVSSLSVDGYRYVVQTQVWANIRPDKKLEAFQWLRENELGALIIETVNSSTLSAQARELLEGGKELEPDYFNTAHKQTTSITKVG